MIRLFAAIPVPPEIAEGLIRRQQGLPGARWRDEEQLHLTLRFFGEVSETTAADIDGELRGVRGEPFEMALAGVGAFGDSMGFRAVWAGVEENPALRTLAGRCEAAARRAGAAPDKRPWQPHVTLAYLRGAHATHVAAWEQTHALLKSPPFRVTWFGLYSSWTSPEGSRYDLEREYALT